MTQNTLHRSGRPPRLTQAQVVATARRIAAKEGVAGLTMRRLAEALGVMPNALYTYLPSKDAILDAVLDDLIGEVGNPPARMEWRNGLIYLMRSYRRALLTQPGLIALTVSRPMYGPQALRLRENMLALLRKGGLGDTNTVIAFFALFAYATGFVAFETARAPGRRDMEQRAEGHRLHASLPENVFPSTRALASRLAKRPSDLEFTRGLRALLSGFASDARAAQPPPGGAQPRSASASASTSSSEASSGSGSASS